MLIKIISGSAYQGFNGLGAPTSVEDFKWTLFRVPFLGNGGVKPVTATYASTGLGGMFLSRRSIVRVGLTDERW